MFTVYASINPGVYATCGFMLPCYPLRLAGQYRPARLKGQNMTMQNFVLLESENEHTGGTGRNAGPLAAFTENFRGHDYFHVRRVYRDNAGAWRATGQGITCRVDQRDAMLGVLLKVLQANGTLAKPNTRGLRNGKAKPAAPDEGYGNWHGHSSDDPRI